MITGEHHYRPTDEFCGNSCCHSRIVQLIPSADDLEERVLDRLGLGRPQGQPSRDIHWHTGASLPVKGNYLANIMVTDTGYFCNIYGYWDGVEPFFYPEDTDDRYPIENILEWAYDGDDV